MMPPSDMNTDPRALTPEERDLAQRLARLGSSGGTGPSSDLDARILAAAHDAVARAPTRQSQRRWPVAFGIAASLALAIGVAWQLRPLPESSAAYQSEMPARMASDAPPDVAGNTATTPAEATAESAVAAQTAAADTASAIPPPPPAAESGAPKPAARVAARPAQPAPAPEAAVVEPDIAFDTPAPAPAGDSATAKAAANAQSQPPSAAPYAAPAVERQKAAPAPATDAAATALPETDTLNRLQSSGTRDAVESDEPGADVPPATMASPEARDAWLARIRELVAAGRVDAARASLREFTHRYPDFQLPADLRALAQ
jgi:resuscitation-promoting factor RpfA